MMSEPTSLNPAARLLPRTVDYHARVADRRRSLELRLGGLPYSTAPVVWEVGCGHGHFLTAYAAAHPQHLCLGVDIVRDRIQRASRKRDRANLPQLHFVLAEAHEFLAALPTPVQFSAIYILFPDPWPKRRHHKNRLLQPAFLEALLPRVGEGTRLYFRTDFEPYFKEVSALIDGQAFWEQVNEPWPFEKETVFQARALHQHSLIARRKLRT